MLREFIALNREEIIRRCRAKVATRLSALTHRGGDQSRRARLPGSTRGRLAPRPDVKSRDWEDRCPARA